ncbi:MAG: thiamine-phosphate kinase [Actinobacteria bacterium]|nr:thiamine-phosphate kinase [Actinomycetota bacterium]
MASPEFVLLELLSPLLDGDGPGVPVGYGDDAAVVEVAGTPVAIAVDTLVAAVHFDLVLSSWEDVGYKALAVNVSDLAAVGAQCSAAVVSLQRPPGLEDADVLALYRGLRAAADTWRCRIVGGDTVGGPVAAVSVTAVGALLGPEPLRRGAAEVGDVVLIVGELGVAAAGLAAHRAGRTDLLEEHPLVAAAHRRPRALPEAGAALAVAGANACIDVSDGLGRDVGHIAAASQVGVVLDPDRLPLHPDVVAVADELDIDPVDLVVGGGDDYALVATVRPHRLARVETALEAAGLRPRVVGEVVEGEGVRLGDRDVVQAGWEHDVEEP